MHVDGNRTHDLSCQIADMLSSAPQQLDKMNIWRGRVVTKRSNAEQGGGGWGRKNVEILSKDYLDDTFLFVQSLIIDQPLQ